MTRNRDTLQNRYSRYVAGGLTEVANSRIEWSQRNTLLADSSDTIYVVEDFYANRLDLIASVFLGDVRYWWVIAQLNNIIDPTSEVKPGLTLRIPEKGRLALMLNTKLGGTESTRLPIQTISPVIT